MNLNARCARCNRTLGDHTTCRGVVTCRTGAGEFVGIPVKRATGLRPMTPGMGARVRKALEELKAINRSRRAA